MACDRWREPSWDGAAYAAEDAHHRAFDDWFLARHRPAPGDVVVDVGCGVGDFTARLADLVPEGHVVGVEPDASMLETASRHVQSNLEFVQGRAQELDQLVATTSVDFVVSRATFHWIPLADYPRCYRAIHDVLRPGGWFHSESGGSGNASRMVAILDRVGARHGLGPAATTFPDAGTAFDLLEEAGFDIPHEGVRTVAQRRTFDREQLLGLLRTQALRAYPTSDDDRDALWADVQACVEDLRRSDGSYDQTLVRLDVLVRRPH